MSEMEELKAFLATEGRTVARVHALINLKIALKGHDFSKGLALCTEALELAQSFEEPLLIALAQRHLANVYWRMGDMVKGQAYFAESLAIFQQHNDASGMAHVYCGLGIIHGTMNDAANALDFFEKGIVAAKRNGEELLLAHLYGNIGNVHIKLEDHISALRYFAKALSMYRELDDEGKGGVANMLGSIAGVLVHQGEYDNAIDHMRQALEIDQRIGDERSMPVRFLNLGITYFKAGQLEQALEYLHRSLELAADQHSNSYAFMVHKELSEVYAAMGNPTKAMEHLDIYDSYQVAEQRMTLSTKAKSLI